MLLTCIQIESPPKPKMKATIDNDSGVTIFIFDNSEMPPVTSKMPLNSGSEASVGKDKRFNITDIKFEKHVDIFVIISMFASTEKNIIYPQITSNVDMLFFIALPIIFPSMDSLKVPLLLALYEFCGIIFSLER